MRFPWYRILAGAAWSFMVVADANAVPDSVTVAQALRPFTVMVEGVENGRDIPEQQAVCVPTVEGRSSTSGSNLRPTITWSDAPKGTKSFAIFMVDMDVPIDGSRSNLDGQVIAANAKRQNFFHYGVVHIPANVTTFVGAALEGANRGFSFTELVNDMGLSQYVSGLTSYGGPCPPWNDMKEHRYQYIVFALDAEAASVINAATPAGCADMSCQAYTARNTYGRIVGSRHVLGSAVVVGTYTLNKKLRLQAH